MAVEECYLPDMTLNGYFRSIAYDCETRTGRLDLGPCNVGYDKATCVWMIRAIDRRVRRVEVTAGCGDACFVLSEKGHWRTVKATTGGRGFLQPDDESRVKNERIQKS